MNKLLLAAASASLIIGVSPAAAENVALLSKGASFVSASSAIALASQLGTLTIMQNDPISDVPVPWYAADGDTRYIFGSDDPAQSYTIDLGRDYSLASFSASFDQTTGFADRPIETLSVATSTDNMTFTSFSGTLASSDGLFTLSGTSVSARYVTYSFGPASDQYPGYGGSAIESVTADTGSAVPEPASWAMMIGGVGFAGAAMRRANRRAAALA